MHQERCCGDEREHKSQARNLGVVGVASGRRMMTALFRDVFHRGYR